MDSLRYKYLSLFSGETKLIWPFYFSLFFYWFTTTNWNIYGWHDQQRIAQIIFLLILFICIAFIIFFSKQGKNSIFINPWSFRRQFTILFLGFSCWGGLSATLCQFLHWALLEWALLLCFCMGVFAIAQLRQININQFDWVVLSILVSVCALYLFAFIGRYATLFTGFPLRVWDMFSGFANIRFFGQFQTMTLPLLAVAVITARSAWIRHTSFVMLSSWWTLSIASGTRGTWLAIATAIVIVWLIGRPAGRNWVRWQIAGIAAGLALYGFMFFAVPALLGNQPQLINRLPTLASLSLRDILWAEAWKMIYAHPWFGIGPMHFAAVPNDIGAHPHNAVLQIAAEWGIPALLMLSTIVAMGFHCFVKHLKAQSNETSFDNLLAVALFASLVAAGVQSLVDGVMVMPYSQVTLMVLAGWAVGICVSSSVLKRKGAWTIFARWKEVAFFGFSVFLLGMVIVLTLPDVPHLQNRIRHYADTHHTAYFHPRFWQQGWINE